jgi:hypothetical protein
MSAGKSDPRIQAKVILDAIAFTDFEKCQPLNRKFDNIPNSPGIYAIRHKTDGLLYNRDIQDPRLLNLIISINYDFLVEVGDLNF